MKEILDTIFAITSVITVIGILGFPFISLSMAGFAAIYEWIEYRQLIWFSKSGAIFCGFFAVGTVVWLITLILKFAIFLINDVHINITTT